MRRVPFYLYRAVDACRKECDVSRTCRNCGLACAWPSVYSLAVRLLPSSTLFYHDSSDDAAVLHPHMTYTRRSTTFL